MRADRGGLCRFPDGVRRWLVLALMLLAAAGPVQPPGKAAVPAVKAGDIAEQLAMLAFDANPLWAIPARERLARWVGPVRLFLFGRAEDRADAQAALLALGRASGLRTQIMGAAEAAAVPPNAFVVADAHIAAAMRGPLRGMLVNAFSGDEATIEAFLATVVEVTPCWMLPVWADAERSVIRAAVIGVDATGPREATRACVLRGLGAALGPMGPGAFLRGSALAPGTAARLSREDERMLRVLYGRALHPGMGRAEVIAAAQKAWSAGGGAGPGARKPKNRAKTPGAR